MRYKNNILNKLSQLEITTNKAIVQTNRMESQNSILETLESIKDQIEETRSMISNEPDDFEQQFAG